jgi:uncharacterized repeat protein (TIGR03803 family)
MTLKASWFAGVFLLSFAAFVCANVAVAQTESVIHSFGIDRDGSYPSGGVISDSNGALYGLTSNGGANSGGSAYKLSPPSTDGGTWRQNVIYSFGTVNAGGIEPSGSLLFEPGTHTLYGTTSRGGSLYGVAFQLTPPNGPGQAWTETILHIFAGGKDGEYPMSGVISNGHNTLYGTTFSGGKYLAGTVFRLSPPKPGGTWTESILYTFTGGVDGGSPAGLVMDSTGALYGTTSSGGQYKHGTVFKVTPPAGGGPWTESVIYSFTGGSDGSAPQAGLIFDAEGSLYGTTLQGGSGLCYTENLLTYCGTVFKLAPPTAQGEAWTETVLYNFLAGSDGALPQSSLIFDSTGSLYGTAESGIYGGGTIFQLTPPSTPGGAWTEQILHSFGGSNDGDLPEGGLLQVGPNFYGTTFGGGLKGPGTVYEMTP